MRLPVLLRAAPVLLGLLGLSGCGTPGVGPAEAGLEPAPARALVVALLPERLRDRAGWAADLTAALGALDLALTPDNLCAVLAVTEQESGYQVDPPVPGLAAIARKELDRRAERAGVPALAVRAALALSSSDGRSWGERLEGVQTERELSDLYEEFIESVPLGRSFLADRNPVRTGGPMQVGVAFAQEQVRAQPYPYPMRGSVRAEVFTRRGGLYFGSAHLLAYRAPYEHMIHRFADFNAGRWASRNAAFQQALALLAGRPLALDGDLLPPPGSGIVGRTEAAALAVAARLEMTPAAVRRELERGSGPDFERSELYRRVFAQAEKQGGRALARAVLPRIDLQSPKFTRKLTTEWFARRVDERHRRCLGRVEAVQAG
ncbi:MAG TPA: DUF1615 domain-containing protein [Rubrivivax sp.]|nr:DUF1615 domain-containing protein [Burkholderiales bacterium]HNT39750.1 DUF1615 domain-containing protein [Rubrivivax sp.]